LVLLLGVLAAFVVALLVTPLMKKIGLKLGAVDKPNERKVHSRVITRIGGFAIYAGFVVPTLFTQLPDRQVLGLVVAGTLIVMVGLFDDLRGMSAKVKLLGQIGAALVLVWFGVEVDYITNPLNGGIISLGKLSLPITIFWLIGVTNAVNLIDGLDGLAAGITAIAALTLAVVAWTQEQYSVVAMALFLTASTLGFLRYNFNPAQLFMGDCGSLFLGFNLGALSVMGLSKGATVISLFIPIIILGIPIMDTFFAITRRFSNKKPIFEPDKGHLHHRLLAMGLTHQQSVLVMYAITFLLGSSAVFLTMLTTAQSVLILIVIILIILLGANRIGIITGQEVPPLRHPETKK